ncbi:PepSY domain-containing protein [Simiduia litorea]
MLTQTFDTETLNQKFGSIEALRLFHFFGKNIARVETATETLYVNALTLDELQNFERDYAIALAQHFVGDTNSAIAAVTIIEAFDDDYLNVNRLLPVTRVTFQRADNMRAYIDTQQGRLATLVDDNKAATSAFFRTLHTWSWWPASTIKTAVMSAFLSLSLLVITMGLWLYIQRWRQGVFGGNARWPMSRRWHAHLNGGTAILALCFVVSGLLHFLVSEQRQASPKQDSSLAPSSLNIPDTIVDAQWVSSGKLGFWRLLTAQPSDRAHAHHGGEQPQQSNIIYQRDGQQIDDGENQLASAMAQHWRAGNIISLSPQRHFTSDYGFINKRLPVTKVAYEDGSLLFVEVQTNTLAAQVTSLDALEGFSFGYLHKWHHLDGLGKHARDALLALAALLIALGTGLGLFRYSQKIRRQRPRLAQTEQAVKSP